MQLKKPVLMPKCGTYMFVTMMKGFANQRAVATQNAPEVQGARISRILSGTPLIEMQ